MLLKQGKSLKEREVRGWNEISKIINFFINILKTKTKTKV
jgi:hypothetical protein